MATSKANIVQAEFFHVGGEDVRSFNKLFNQMRERILDGLELTLAAGKEASSGIKTCVRFYDLDGTVTPRVQNTQRLEEAYTETLEILGESKPGSFHRWWFGGRLRRLHTKKELAKAQATTCVVRAFFYALKMKGPVAVERNDHSFRPMHGNEAHELAEAAANSKGVWLFVFRPNDLLSDTNTSVAHAF